jgi:hypothetical protein
VVVEYGLQGGQHDIGGVWGTRRPGRQIVYFDFLILIEELAMSETTQRKARHGDFR